MNIPFERPHANSITRHHLLFEKPEWKKRTRSKEVHQLGSFIVDVVRSDHDYLHNIIKPVPVPGLPVLNVMRDIGYAYSENDNDANRVEYMLDDLIDFAKFTTSPQQCHEMLEVATSLDAQMCILGFMKAIGPYYETKSSAVDFLYE